MKPRKITIDWNPSIFLVDERRGTAEVDGWPIKIPHLDGYEWFVVRCPNGLWSVTEASTGMKAADASSTRRAAVKNARTVLAKVTPAQMAATIRRVRAFRDPTKVPGPLAARRAARRRA